MALGLLKQRGENRSKRDDHADEEERKPHRSPKRGIAGRTRLLRDVGVGDAERDHREEEERSGQDVKVAAHVHYFTVQTPIMMAA